MTTVHSLPEEILLLIFDEFDFDDLLECHTVCHAWYSAAHVKMLKEVTFKKVSAILQFIASIDRNPDPLFLKAVKKIHIYLLDEDDQYRQSDSTDRGLPSFRFGKENLMKLFFRFPKLEQVKFYDSLFILEEFDDEICESFQQIGSFVVEASDESSARFQDLRKRLRHLITSVKITGGTSYEHMEVERGGVADFIAKFPRAQKVECDYCVTLQQWCSILKHLPNLTIIDTFPGKDDENTEMYILTKPKDERMQLIKRISEIRDLTFDDSEDFSLNSLKFIAKYMTGLTKLSLHCSLFREWTDLNQLLYCNIASDLAYSINDCGIQFHLEESVLPEYLPIITNKVFQQTASSELTNKPNRLLRLNICRSDEYELTVVSNQRQRNIDIFTRRTFDFNHFAKIFKRDILLHDVDEFILNISLDYALPAKMGMYKTVLKVFPSLKKLTLDLPAGFVDSTPVPRVNSPSLPLLEELTLRSPTDIQCQTLLNEFCKMCPKLKKFNFYGFSGTRKDHIGEYQMELPNYALETLVVDIASIVGAQAAQPEAKDFFVLETEFISNSESRQLYKVNVNLFEPLTTIDDKDLKGLTRGVHYFRLHITIKSLQTLILFNLDSSREDFVDLRDFTHAKLLYEYD